MPVNPRLKATGIIGQKKSFLGKRIPESSCARKETAEIDIRLRHMRHAITCANVLKKHALFD